MLCIFMKILKKSMISFEVQPLSLQRYFSFRVSTVGTLYLERRLDYSQVQTIQLNIVVKVNVVKHKTSLELDHNNDHIKAVIFIFTHSFIYMCVFMCGG